MHRNRMILPLALIAPLALAGLAGCSSKPDPVPVETADMATGSSTGAPGLAGADTKAMQAAKVSMTDARVQLPAVPGRPAAGYFVLTPGPDASGNVTSVAVGHFARAEFHQSKLEGGVMTMGPIDSLPLVPGKPIVFAPGGFHVMLFDGDGLLKPGDRTEITLTLDTGKKIIASASVTAAGGEAMPGMKM